MDDGELKKTLESLLFITDRPLPAGQLSQLTGAADPERVAAIVSEIGREMEARGSSVSLMEVAGGFQMATKPSYASYVRQLFADRLTMRLSAASLETISIIAYKQPLTRAEIEDIRGVEVIAALETLLEKRLIKVVGRKETVGRPLMYGTTPEFLRQFGLKSLEDLPALDSLEVPAPEANATPDGVGDATPSSKLVGDVPLAAPAALPEGPFSVESPEAPTPEALPTLGDTPRSE